MNAVASSINGTGKIKVSDQIADLIKRRTRGYSLEAPFYADDAIFELDMDAIFSRHWICVGVDASIPEPGDYMTVNLPHNSIILVRNNDEEVKALRNSCCHRGARMLHDQTGSVGNIVCPYHQWTYNLDGQLIFNQFMGPDFHVQDHHLQEVALRNVAGVLFICLSDNPPDDIDDMAEALASYIKPHQLENAKIADSYEFIEESNWKVTMDNNRECYHCAANHPELLNSYSEFGTGMQRTPENAASYDAWEKANADAINLWETSCSLPSAELDKLDSPTAFRLARTPIAGSGESQTMNSKVACKKLMGDFKRADLGSLSFWTHPNAWFHFMSDHVVAIYFLPLGANKTLIHTDWLVHKDAVEGSDYDLDNLTKVWRATNAEDKYLVRINQLGIEDEGYVPGQYSPLAERFPEKFCTWYIDRLTALTTNA